MNTLDFEKNVNSFSDNLDKETMCTVIIFISDGLKGNLPDLNNNLREAFNKTIFFIGLSRVESEGYKEDSVNLLIVDHKVSTSDLKTIENFNKQLGVVSLSFYIKYEDLDNTPDTFLGRIIPVSNNN